MRVLVLASPEADFLAPLRELPGDVEVKVGRDLETLAAFLPSADVLVSHGHHGALLAQAFERAPNVKWVHSLSAGVEEICFPALRASTVPLTNARGVYKKSLAEWTILAMLYFAKDVPRLREHQARREWAQFDCQMLQGATLLIIGYGEIGRAVARLAKPFGMTVIGTKRRTAEGDELADEIVSPEGMASVLSRADFVVCAAPLTPETRRMIGAREFAAMKAGAVFVNIGRGAVVDEPAMVEALRRGPIRGAALDVFDVEPLPAESPLWTLPNVLISPHCADHTATWQHESVAFFVENFGRWRRGEPLLNLVDKEAGY